MMEKEMMTNDEKANDDKLHFYFNEKVKVHIILKRKTKFDKNVWMNGYIVRHPTERLWIINESQFGEVRLSISEIASGGVDMYKESSKW